MLNQIDLSRTDLNLLALFEIVLEEQHVGRAAERLRLSPSAVSHGLGRLRRLLNDPLFLRTPKGVVPTARATELSEPIADILARARNVIATAAPFDAAQSTRRFTIGSADGFSIFLPALMAELEQTAPNIDIVMRHMQRETAIADLDARAIDLASPHSTISRRGFSRGRSTKRNSSSRLVAGIRSSSFAHARPLLRDAASADRAARRPARARR